MRRCCRTSATAWRSASGSASVGTGAISSGDLFLAFASGNRELGTEQGELPLRMLGEGEISPLYDAVIDATEEAILNAMLAAQTMTGWRGNTAYALEPELLLEALRRS